MLQLHETHMGKKLIENTFPEIAKQLKRIADSLEKLEPREDEDEKDDLDHLSSTMYGVDNNQ